MNLQQHKISPYFCLKLSFLSFINTNSNHQLIIKCLHHRKIEKNIPLDV